MPHILKIGTMISKQRLFETLSEYNLDAIIASSPQNVFYLSGLQSLTQRLLGQHAFVIWTPHLNNPLIILPSVDASIIVDKNIQYDSIYTFGNFFMYEGSSISPSDLSVQTIKNTNNFPDPISALLSAIKSIIPDSSTIALEQSGFSVSEFSQVSSKINPDIILADDIISDLRMIKNSNEIKYLKQAAKINQAAVESAITKVTSGITERDLANHYESELISNGAYPLFTAIGFGSHGAYPHAIPGKRIIEAGDLIRFDVGCTYENYSSDIARTFSFGASDPILQQKYEVLCSSMNHGIEMLHDGVQTNTIFDEIVGYIRDNGPSNFSNFNRNHVGHGIGIDVYDHPTISPDNGILKDGMVLCIEPPYYELGTAGIQVEDEVHITSHGTERFTHSPSTLIAL